SACRLSRTGRIDVPLSRSPLRRHNEFILPRRGLLLMRLTLRRLCLVALLFVAIPASAQPPAPDEAAIERMRKDIFFLAGPECEGRGVGTAGLDRAADHVATASKAAGLKPAMTDGSYFQPFTMNAFPEIDNPSSLAFEGP